MADDVVKFLNELGIEVISNESTMGLTYKESKYNFNIGDKYGRLEIIGLIRYRDNSNTVRKACVCKCSCGNIIGPSRLYQLISGDLISCGCFSRDVHSTMLKEKNTKHGYNTRYKREPLYNVWVAMIQRCNYTGRKDSKYYSIKEIQVCNEWASFEKFRDWALSHGYKNGLTIDRKDNSIGYNPDNCRFITIQEQQLNKSNVHLITYNGITDSISGWAKRIGVSWSTLNNRLNKYKSIGKALGFEE